MEGAMNNHIAQMIREEVAINVQREFEKRDAKDKGKKNEEEKEVEIEGAFRTSQCPSHLKVIFTVGMLRNSGERWWDGLLAIKKGALDNVEWPEFKELFFKEFRSEAEVTKLRSEFLNDCQGNMSLNEFRAQFLDKAQFCPEFLENDQLLKEQFYLKLRKNLREKINLRQMESFSMLADVARDHEIEMSRVDEGVLKRRYEDVNSPSKRPRQESSSSNHSNRRNVPFCRQCKKNHSGVCRAADKGCYTYGKPGHTSREWANRSFVATRVIHVIPVSKLCLENTLQVEVGNGRMELVKDVYKGCEIKISLELFQANLIPFPMGEFDIILGMDWLSSCNAKIACDEKAVYLKTSKGEDLVVYGDRKERSIFVCTFACAKRYISHGCHAYLSHIVDVEKQPLFIKDIPIVNEFADVFLEDLPGIPPERQYEFSIDLIPGANPIAKAPYRLAPTEM
uniref:uncharacterized protein LOC122610359 n=1 Tax=Erigeron canadensis TaxID=72917 RepID=UPI001CB9332A|nr:uncharacterized protein LOC122610359 [Erigeron canadensis]